MHLRLTSLIHDFSWYSSYIDDSFVNILLHYNFPSKTNIIFEKIRKMSNAEIFVSTKVKWLSRFQGAVLITLTVKLHPGTSASYRDNAIFLESWILFGLHFPSLSSDSIIHLGHRR